MCWVLWNLTLSEVLFSHADNNVTCIKCPLWTQTRLAAPYTAVHILHDAGFRANGPLVNR